jgi:WD40 repeat protein
VVVSGSNYGTVRVWDVATGAAVGDPFTGHTGPVHSVAFGQVEVAATSECRWLRNQYY